MSRQFRILPYALAVGCIALFPISGVAQVRGANSADEWANLVASVKALAEQVRALRVEVTELRLESQERAVPLLQGEIEKVAAERAALQGEESRARQQLQSFDQQVAANTLSPDEHLQAQNLRVTAGADVLDRVRHQQTALHARQQQIETRMRAEIQRFNSLLEKAKTLRSGPAN